MKPYELVVLLHPDLEIDLDKPMKKIETIIKEYKGSITHSDIWGKRKLAYKIAKQDFAVYVYYEVELDPESLSQIESAFNIADEVLRYLITYPVPKVEEEAKAGDDDDTKEAADKKVTAKTESTK